MIPRCGDIVKHGPSGQEWEVAYADATRNELTWFGWPEGIANLDDCTITERCSDEQHAQAVAQWLDRPGAMNATDMRTCRVRELYRPEEHKRLAEQRRIERIEVAITALGESGVPETAIVAVAVHLSERKAAL